MPEVDQPQKSKGHNLMSERPMSEGIMFERLKIAETDSHLPEQGGKGALASPSSGSAAG